MDDVRNKEKKLIVCIAEYDREEVILNHHSKISLPYTVKLLMLAATLFSVFASRSN